MGLLRRRKGKKILEGKFEEVFGRRMPFPEPGRKLGGRLVPLKKKPSRTLATETSKVMLKNLDTQIGRLTGSGGNPTGLAELKLRRRLLQEEMDRNK